MNLVTYWTNSNHDIHATFGSIEILLLVVSYDKVFQVLHFPIIAKWYREINDDLKRAPWTGPTSSRLSMQVHAMVSHAEGR